MFDECTMDIVGSVLDFTLLPKLVTVQWDARTKHVAPTDDNYGSNQPMARWQIWGFHIATPKESWGIKCRGYRENTSNNTPSSAGFF